MSELSIFTVVRATPLHASTRSIDVTRNRWIFAELVGGIFLCPGQIGSQKDDGRGRGQANGRFLFFTGEKEVSFDSA